MKKTRHFESVNFVVVFRGPNVEKGYMKKHVTLYSLSGDPTGNRTPVSGVRGQRPNR